MECADYRKAIPGYLAGDGTDEERLAMDEHASRCPTCADAVRQERELDAMLRRAVAVEPADLTRMRDRVRAGIAQHCATPSHPRKLVPFLTRVVPIAAVFAIAGIIGWNQYSVRRETALYRAAVADHIKDLVHAEQRPGWQSSPAEISAFAALIAGSADIPERVAPAGYRLVKARACRLGGSNFGHFIYERDGREVSVFVRREHGVLRGPTVHVERDVPIRGYAVNAFETAAFQANAFTVVVVAELPRELLVEFSRQSLSQLM